MTMGKPVALTLIEEKFGQIGNTDAYTPLSYLTLEDFKRKRFESHYFSKRVQMPIIIRSHILNNLKPDFLAGNTRLTGLIFKKFSREKIIDWLPWNFKKNLQTLPE